MRNKPPVTPIGQANSLVTAISVLSGVGAYFAQTNNVAIVSKCCEGMRVVLYGWVPTLGMFHIPPAFIGALGAALLVFIAGTVCAPTLSKMFSPRIGTLEDQMRGLQRKRRPRSVKIR